MLYRQEGLKMMAANGTDIKNFGRKLVKFRGVDAAGERDFTRQA